MVISAFSISSRVFSAGYITVYVRDVLSSVSKNDKAFRKMRIFEKNVFFVDFFIISLKIFLSTRSRQYWLSLIVTAVKIVEK